MKKEKIIGFDIDDTLTDVEEYEYNKLQEWCMNVAKIGRYNGLINKQSVTFEGRYPNLEYIQVKRFLDWYFPKQVREAPFREYIKELFDILHEKGYKVYIITRRDALYDGKYTGAMMKEDTITRFKNEGIEYDRIFFGCKNKLKTLEDENVDVLVDDSPMNIMQVSTKYPAIVMDTSFNKDLVGKNIYHIQNFEPGNFMDLLEEIFYKGENIND